MPTNLSAEEKINYMAEVQRTVVDYLQEEAKINSDALKAYEPNSVDDNNRDPEVKKIREIQAMILRDRINEINRHIAVIKRMYPNA
jgi:ribosomal protein S15P/S13E